MRPRMAGWEGSRQKILEYIDKNFRWPPALAEWQRRDILQQGFAHKDGRYVHLTSLGELEIGYPETARENPRSGKTGELFVTEISQDEEKKCGGCNYSYTVFYGIGEDKRDALSHFLDNEEEYGRGLCGMCMAEFISDGKFKITGNW